MTLIDKAEALLPCPFCGSTMQVAMRDAMLCLECYAAGPQDEDRKTAWNRRALPARGVGERGDAKEVAKLLAEFIDATLRRNTERDGNWGYPSFHDETRDISARLEAIITTEERK